MEDSHPTSLHAVNPEAGQHAFPTDARIVAAALAAGERVWNRHPYLELRFGERGRRFTSSDSGWLATLADLELAQICEQVNWLASVLASRGLPSAILGDHLEELTAHLCQAAPERAQTWERLAEAGRQLTAGRCHALSARRQAGLAAQFLQATTELESLCPRAGELLAWAVADERAGCERAVEALTVWLLDPARFPAEWIEAGRRVLEAAREPEIQRPPAC